MPRELEDAEEVAPLMGEITGRRSSTSGRDTDVQLTIAGGKGRSFDC